MKKTNKISQYFNKIQEVIKKLLLRRGSELRKTIFRSNECGCVFKIRNFLSALEMRISIVKPCEDHKKLAKGVNLDMKVDKFEEALESGEFVVDTVSYMKLNRKNINGQS